MTSLLVDSNQPPQATAAVAHPSAPVVSTDTTTTTPPPASAIKSPSLFPSTKQLSVAIKGDRFDFLVQSYSDRIFVVISQKSRIGQMLTASVSQSITSRKITFHVQTILGIETDFCNLLARRLIAGISKTTPKPLLLGLSFSKHTAMPHLPAILQCIEQIKLW